MLLPKFAGLCPEHLEDAINGLAEITMVEAGPSTDVVDIDASDILAIRGLAALAEAAAHEGQEKPMERVVDQLLRWGSIQPPCLAFLCDSSDDRMTRGLESGK